VYVTLTVRGVLTSPAALTRKSISVSTAVREGTAPPEYVAIVDDEDGVTGFVVDGAGLMTWSGKVANEVAVPGIVYPATLEEFVELTWACSSTADVETLIGLLSTET
jgi:hypothetical protein